MEKPSGMRCARRVGAGLGGQEVREVGGAELVLLAALVRLTQRAACGAKTFLQAIRVKL